MDKSQTENEHKLPSKKSFMTAGPTLHYSHKNVQKYWFLALFVFALSCCLWSKILTGSFWSFSLLTLISPKFWRLGDYVVSGVSIFEYPWQILVIGMLMGILAVVPILISQLMSFRYSLPFILAVVILANLPGFAIGLLISCIAVACRPLRFRSRFIAIALCTAPQLIYWGYFGPAAGVEPIRWGFSFTPWICAWQGGLLLAGIVLGIGHFTRYRPGLVWMVTFVVLLAAFALFQIKIGFDELDFQLYVAKNNPEHISEFHDHSITEALDETITNQEVKNYLLEAYFFPAEPIPLRIELKKQLQEKLANDRWPNWFIVPNQLKYQKKRQQLFEQYDLFINKRQKSHRMPIALYYKALLSEYSPDIKAIGQKEVLTFYSDYPHERSLNIWHKLYRSFKDSPESIEARWRIAGDWAGKGRFDKAQTLLDEAQAMVTKRFVLLDKETTQNDSFFRPFRPPADSVITKSKLHELQRRLNLLCRLIGTENRGTEQSYEKRLAKFVLLNTHTPDYTKHLDKLLEQIGNQDPLADNVLLAQTKLIADTHLRAEELAKLHNQMSHTDGGMQALFELALLKISMWQNEANLEEKKKYLAQARATLETFSKLYPKAFCTDQAKEILENLPAAE